MYTRKNALILIKEKEKGSMVNIKKKSGIFRHNYILYITLLTKNNQIYKKGKNNSSDKISIFSLCFQSLSLLY